MCLYVQLSKQEINIYYSDYESNKRKKIKAKNKNIRTRNSMSTRVCLHGQFLRLFLIFSFFPHLIQHTRYALRGSKWIKSMHVYTHTHMHKIGRERTNSRTCSQVLCVISRTHQNLTRDRTVLIWNRRTELLANSNFLSYFHTFITISSGICGASP